MAKKAAAAKQKYEDCVRERAFKQREYNEKCREQEKTARMVEDLKKEIESKMRERKLLGKDVVDAQEKERQKKDEMQTKNNELMKIRNKHTAYSEEIEKLQKANSVLTTEKEKYGIEASQANARYYECLEQVKLKNNLIAKLQRKNIDAEARLKTQFNLYEQVRSDRNLYSKNLLEAFEEIAELKTKFKRMTAQISQLKDEITMKDTQKQVEDELKSMYAK